MTAGLEAEPVIKFLNINFENNFKRPVKAGFFVLRISITPMISKGFSD